MTRRVCLAIGVSTVMAPDDKALRFPFLDGAVLAARNVGQWAIHAGYAANDVKVIDDGVVDGVIQPVSKERVQDVIDELFASDLPKVDHLVLAFCGHGITDENVGSISWLFSDSERLKYRVLAEKFVAELSLTGVRRITLISDACREPPAGLDLMRWDAVRGIVVHASRSVAAEFDRLVACQDGHVTYMVSDPAAITTPGKCVFSGVVVDALFGHEPLAVDNQRISTTSLASCLRTRVPARARDYGLHIVPQCVVGPDPEVLYHGGLPLGARDILQTWPAPKVSAPPGVLAEVTEPESTDAKTLRLGFSVLFGGFSKGDSVSGNPVSRPAGALFSDKRELQGVLQRRARVVRLRAGADSDLARSFESVARSLGRRIDADDRKKANVVALEGIATVAIGRGNVFVSGSEARVHCRGGTIPSEDAIGENVFAVPFERDGEPALVEIADGRMIPVALYSGMFAALSISLTGDVFTAYGRIAERDAYDRALDTVRRFAGGELDVGAVDRIAAGMRGEKHFNPVVGAICAYLYRAIADLDSIRRMAYYYWKNDQPVPFDIALLGEIPTERTDAGLLEVLVPAVGARRATDHGGGWLPEFVTRETKQVQAAVGGLCPWIGLGWDYVTDARPECASLVKGLVRFAPTVRRTGATAFSPSVGRVLARRWSI